MTIKSRIEKPICTKSLILLLLSLFWISKKSIEKEVVSEVKAESALEYAAAIIPKIKIIEVKKPNSFNANKGYKSSVLVGNWKFTDSE